MKKPMVALAALNAAVVLSMVAGGAILLSQGPVSTSGPASAAAQSETIAQLEQRIAVLEEREGIGPAQRAGEALAVEAPLDPAAVEAAPGEAAPSDGAEAPALASTAEDGRPVTRGELKAMVKTQLAAQQKKQWEDWGKKNKKPKKSIPEVARELNLTPQQGQDVRAPYKDLEGQSMAKLFGIETDGLETLKKQLAQAEWDPDLKAQLRETIAVNWTRQQAEFGVLYVQLDARLRKVMDAETLARFYRFEVALAEPGYPDIEAMFFPENKTD
jgi:hypothetical protein